MKIYCTQDYKAMSRKAANILSAQVILNPNSVLGLATGSTPIGTYQQLIDWYKKGDLDFEKVTSINLDEYAGLAPDHDQSYRYFMQKNFFDHINIRPENTYVPNGMAADLEAECRRYNGIIEKYGPIDIQLLGMGHNGHIGFNEPGRAFELNTHVVELTQSTIEANARFFSSVDEVPKKALTMGIKTIMQAKRVLVVVSGQDKAEIVERAFLGEVTTQVPASILQMHPDVTLVGDQAALSRLMKAGVTA
jgi:glucosamine-6-phosphate deaminase